MPHTPYGFDWACLLLIRAGNLDSMEEMNRLPQLSRHVSPAATRALNCFIALKVDSRLGYLFPQKKKNANPLRAQFIKQDHVCFCLGSCCPCRWPHGGPVDLCCFRTLNQAASEGLQVRATFIRRGSVFICMLLLSGNQFLPRVTTECSHFLRSLSSKSVS